MGRNFRNFGTKGSKLQKQEEKKSSLPSYELLQPATPTTESLPKILGISKESNSSAKHDRNHPELFVRGLSSKIHIISRSGPSLSWRGLRCRLGSLLLTCHQSQKRVTNSYTGVLTFLLGGIGHDFDLLGLGLGLLEPFFQLIFCLKFCMTRRVTIRSNWKQRGPHLPAPKCNP